MLTPPVPEYVRTLRDSVHTCSLLEADHSHAGSWSRMDTPPSNYAPNLSRLCANLALLISSTSSSSLQSHPTKQYAPAPLFTLQSSDTQETLLVQILHHTRPHGLTSLQNGVYHHVTGVDASSSASLAAYVNTLIFSSSDKTQKVVSGTYRYGSRRTTGAWDHG